MNKSEQENNSSKTKVKESVGTSLRSSPEQRQSIFYENLSNNSRSKTNQILLNQTSTKLIEKDFPSRCDQCKHLIDQKSEKEIEFYNHFYHEHCFKCSNCQKSLINQKNLFKQNSKPCCEECYEQDFSPICEQCFKPISNQKSLIYNENKYHLDCFRCFKCNQIINDSLVSTQNSKPCCSKCYEQDFAPICQQCLKPISSGKSLIYNENKYHPDCFRCFKCNKIIIESPVSTYNSKVCCSQCYEEYFTRKCFQCLKSILSGKSIVYNENEYHPDCFRCCHCDKIIVEKQFSTQNSKPCCLKCYEQNFAPKCFQCLKSISNGKSLIYNENKYHEDCFRCFKCNKIIIESPVSTYNSKACCSQCYEEYFGVHCSKCSKVIIDKYTTFQGKSFHIECFICDKCHRIIQSRDKFYDDPLGIFCSRCII